MAEFAENWMNLEGNPNRAKLIKRGTLLLLGIIFIWILFPFGTIHAGERGIRLRFNAVSGDVVREGLYFRIPLIEEVIRLDVKTQKIETQALAYSKDIQSVDATIALNYHLNPDAVQRLYEELGVDYRSRIIDPAIQESLKAATAKFTAQELIEKRPLVKEEIKAQLMERLGNKYIIVDDFSIVNFDFSNIYEQAVEQKQKAQQDALRAENDLKRVQFESEQRVAQATAEAEAIRIQAQAITQQGGRDYVQLKAVEKWDGKLPTQMIPGGTVPFIDLSR